MPHESRSEMKWEARAAFGKLGPEILPDLLGALHGPVPAGRMRSAAILSLLGPGAEREVSTVLGPTAGAGAGPDVAFLIDALCDSTEAIRLGAVVMLGSIGEPAGAAVEPLQKIFADTREEEGIRGLAAVALYRLGGEERKTMDLTQPETFRLLGLGACRLFSVLDLPRDWDDRMAWDLYFMGITSAPEDALIPMEAFDFGRQYAEYLDQHGFRKIWFPGCGVSLSPHLFRQLGFDVTATDFSWVAIAVQKSFARQPLPKPGIAAPGERRPRSQGKEIELRVHDFRTPSPLADFDCIINRLSFQGLPAESMRKAARTFYDALRPGGHAIFEFMNVQGKLRDDIVDCLRDSGFYIPFERADGWYRRALRETGAPFVFVMGAPMLPGGLEEYQGEAGEERLHRDQKALEALRPEYEKRLKEEETEVERLEKDGRTKLVRFCFGTG